MNYDTLTSLARAYREAQKLGASEQTIAELSRQIQNLGQKDYSILQGQFRRLLLAEADWHLVEELFFSSARLQNDPEHLAMLIEAGVMRGEQLDRLFAQRELNLACYVQLHPATRQHLRAFLKDLPYFQEFMFQQKFAHWLTPWEREVVLKVLVQNSAEEALVYSLMFTHSEIESALGERLLQAALQFELKSVATRMLRSLEVSNEVREKLKRLIRALPEADLGEQLQTVPVEQRLELFKPLLKNISAHGSLSLVRYWVQTLCADPFAWLGRSSSSLNLFAQLLVEHAKHLSPEDGLKVFVNHILTYLEPETEVALWEPWLSVQRSAHDPYFRAVALVHLFVAGSSITEEQLWEAKQIVQTHRREHLPDWEQIVARARQALTRFAQSLGYSPSLRLAQLTLTCKELWLSPAELSLYLRKVDKPCIQALSTIRRHVVNHNDSELEKLTLQTILASGLQNNGDLRRLWFLQRSSHPDLAWRTASLLQARQALPPTAKNFWQGSGEARSFYSVQTLNEEDMAEAMKFWGEAVRLQAWVKALEMFAVGPVVSPLAHADFGRLADLSSFETALLQLPKVGKLLRRSWLRKTSSKVSQPFFYDTTLIIQPWSFFFARLCEGLRIHTEEVFTRTCDCVFPIAQEQRRVQHRYEVRVLLTLFAIQIATLLYPSHSQALQALTQMRDNLSLRRRWEAWLLSESYSAYRLRKGLTTQTPVPDSLFDGISSSSHSLTNL